MRRKKIDLLDVVTTALDKAMGEDSEPKPAPAAAAVAADRRARREREDRREKARRNLQHIEEFGWLTWEV